MLTVEQEQKIVQLTTEIAKAIIPLGDILNQLGIDADEWEFLSRTRAFKSLLENAQAEWSSAANTHKRAKLKAAAVIEAVLPTFYKDMVNTKEALASRAKVLETIGKIAGLGGPDAMTAPQGNVFRLQINFPNGEQPVTFEMGRKEYSESNSGDTTVSQDQISLKLVPEGELEDL
jgi:hypothetical protein